MESLVLCPEELCLGPASTNGALPNAAAMMAGLAGAATDAADLSIWTNEALEKGTRFLPWKGTVRSDKLAVFNKLPEFDVRHRFGLYDEVTEVPSPVPGVTLRLRQCNWIRFLRYSLVYTDAVNVVGTKGPTGEPIFELIKDVDAKAELVCFFVPERPEEAFLLPAIQYLRHTLFKKLVDNVLEESPLDLSTTLVSSKVFPVSPTHSEGRKSVSSDCTSTTTNESSNSSSVVVSSAGGAMTDLFAKGFTVPKAPPHALSVEALTSKVERSKPPTPTITESNNNRMSPPSATVSSPSLSGLPTTIVPSTPSAVGPKVKKESAERRRVKSMLPCNYCGKAFDRPSLLKRHIRIHTGERPHVCDICSKGFSTSSSLNTHRRIHSGEKPHQCGVCGKRFTASSNLYYHKMTHVKEKPHKCTMCSKSFPTPGDLKSHTYVHTGTWPFKCNICHRGFSKQTNLKNHLLLHSGDKPFSCDICQKKFALSCNLRAHLKTHEAEFQSSQASLALYQRAIAMLGQQQQQQQAVAAGSPSSSSPKSGDEDEEMNGEEEQEEARTPKREEEEEEEEEEKRSSGEGEGGSPPAPPESPLQSTSSASMDTPLSAIPKLTVAV